MDRHLSTLSEAFCAAYGEGDCFTMKLCVDFHFQEDAKLEDQETLLNAIKQLFCVADFAEGNLHRWLSYPEIIKIVNFVDIADFVNLHNFVYFDDFLNFVNLHNFAYVVDFFDFINIVDFVNLVNLVNLIDFVHFVDVIGSMDLVCLYFVKWKCRY